MWLRPLHIDSFTTTCGGGTHHDMDIHAHHLYTLHLLVPTYETPQIRPSKGRENLDKQTPRRKEIKEKKENEREKERKRKQGKRKKRKKSPKARLVPSLFILFRPSML